MSSRFIRPLSFSAVSSTNVVAGSLANLDNDLPGMTLRQSVASNPSFVVDMGPGTISYDHVILVGTNLRATDQVLVSTGTTLGADTYAGTLSDAFIGEKPELGTSKVVVQLPSTFSDRYIRVELRAPSHPDSYVQIQRLVVGKAVLSSGIAYDPEFTFEDSSPVSSGPGYRSVDRYPTTVAWKISTGWITEISWRSEWFPMLLWAGTTRAIFFIPDDMFPENWQTDAIFGWIVTKASGKAQGWNAWRFEATIASISA